MRLSRVGGSPGIYPNSHITLNESSNHLLTNPSFWKITRIIQEPTDTSKQPIRTLYLGHVTGYQPIRDQYFGSHYLCTGVLARSQDEMEESIEPSQEQYTLCSISSSGSAKGLLLAVTRYLVRHCYAASRSRTGPRTDYHLPEDCSVFKGRDKVGYEVTPVISVGFCGGIISLPRAKGDGRVRENSPDFDETWSEYHHIENLKNVLVKHKDCFYPKPNLYYLQQTCPTLILSTLTLKQEPTDTSKQPIRTRYIGHVTGYQPIRDQSYLCTGVLARSHDEIEESIEPSQEQYTLCRMSSSGKAKGLLLAVGEMREGGLKLSLTPSVERNTIESLSACKYQHQEPTETSKEPIRTRYLGRMTGYQPISDHYFLIRPVSYAFQKQNRSESSKMSHTT
eukprot:sb/3465468/